MKNQGNAFGRKGMKKHFNGKFGNTLRGHEIVFGNIGILSTESGLLKDNVILAMSKVAKRYIKDKGKLFTRIQADFSITKKVKDSTLGGGAGKFSHLGAFVRSGKVLFELSGLDDQESRKALREMSIRCPLKTIIVNRRKFL